MFIKTNERKERILCIISYRWKFPYEVTLGNFWDLSSSLSFAKNNLCDNFILEYFFYLIGSSFLCIFHYNYLFTTNNENIFFCFSVIETITIIICIFILYKKFKSIYLETYKLYIFRKESSYICNNVME